MQNGLHTLIIFYLSDVLIFHICNITYYALTGLFKQGKKMHKSNNNLVFFYKNNEAKKSWEAARHFRQSTKRPSHQYFGVWV